MDELYILLNEFKDITLKAIKLIDEEKFEDLLNILESRDLIIKKIDSLHFEKENFILICKEFNISELDEKLNVLVNCNYIEVKKNLSSLKMNRKLSKKYQNTEFVDSMFVSQKI